MKFLYKAHKPGEERLIEGEIDAPDKFSISRQMRDQGLILVLAEPKGTKWLDFQRINEIVVSVKLHDKVTFANNLSAMISAGLSLSRSLEVLERQTRNPKFKRALRTIIQDVNDGKSLSTSLAMFPNIFSPVFIAMVAAGEESGNLPNSLKIVGDQMEKTYTIQRKVKGAIMYPGVIMVAMIIIGILMLAFVVPNLVSTFKEFKVDLPLSTQFIINLSALVTDHGAYMLIVAVILATILYKWSKTKMGRRIVDFVVLHTPVISPIVKQVNTATTSRTLASLIASGVNMVESLDITARVLQNSYYKDVLLKAKDGVQKGDPLSVFFQHEEKIFPILLGELTEVGEETGKLSDMLANVATFYENEVEAITKDMSTVIEPILMVIIGLFVGFFAISMVQPIYSITNAI